MMNAAATFVNLDNSFVARPVVDPPITSETIKEARLQFIDVIASLNRYGQYVAEKRLVLSVENGYYLSGFGVQVLAHNLEPQGDVSIRESPGGRNQVRRFRRRIESAPQCILIVPKVKFADTNGEFYLDIYRPPDSPTTNWVKLTTGFGSPSIDYYLAKDDNLNLTEPLLTYEYLGEIIDDCGERTVLEIDCLGRSVYYELPNEPGKCGGMGKHLKSCIFGEVRQCELLRPFIVSGNEYPGLYSALEAIQVVAKVEYKRVLKNAEARAVENGSFLIESPANELRTFRSIVSLDPIHQVPFTCFQGAAVDPVNLYILTHPLCPRGSLRDIKSTFLYEFGVPEDAVHRWFRQIVSGLCALASIGICHMDLTLHNILIENFGDKSERVFLNDFGMTAQLPINPINRRYGLLEFPVGDCGKLLYRPPEYESVGPPMKPVHGPAVDVWMLGVCLLLLFTRNSLIKGHEAKVVQWRLANSDEVSLYDWMGRLNVFGNDEFVGRATLRTAYPQAYDLIIRMLRRDPWDRISLQEIQRHPWYQGYGQTHAQILSEETQAAGEEIAAFLETFST